MKNTFLPFLLIIGIVVVLFSFDNQPPKAQASGDEHEHHQHDAGEEPKSTGKAAIGGEFHLTNQYGKPIDNSSLIGGYNLVFFGFTNCPAICPTGLANITAALNVMGKDTPITPIFITLDAERDTVSHLANHMKNFHESFVALTGTLEDVKQAADSYKVYFSINKESSDDKDYDISHSAFIYLMDKKGEYQAHFPYDIDATKLAEKLTKLTADNS